MVKLEKLLYEQTINSQLFGRARVIATPRKWNLAQQNPSRILYGAGLSKSIFGSLNRLFEPVRAMFVYRWIRDIVLQRGLAMEDLMIYSEFELRRDFFIENVWRQR